MLRQSSQYLCSEAMQSCQGQEKGQKNCGSSILLEDIAHKYTKYTKDLHLKKDLTQYEQIQIERSMKNNHLETSALNQRRL
jgi:hypothetical protein